MGGKHGTPGILPYFIGFPKGLETPDCTHDENSSCFTLVMTCHLPANREVWESSRLLYLMPLGFPMVSGKLLFCPGEDSFSTFACDLPTPGPYRPRFTPTGLRTQPHQGSLANQSAIPSAHEEGKHYAFFSHCYPLTLPHLVPLTSSLRLASLNR